jgi:hypothetical protein
MIAHKTFSATHFWNFAGTSALGKLEDLRERAEQFISARIEPQDVISITETRDAYASSVTVWYRTE